MYDCSFAKQYNTSKVTSIIVSVVLMEEFGNRLKISELFKYLKPLKTCFTGFKLDSN